MVQKKMDIGKTVLEAGLVGAGVALQGTAMKLIEKVSPVKDAMVVNGLTIAVGLGILYFVKNDMVSKIATGLVAGSVYKTAQKLLPSVIGNPIGNTRQFSLSAPFTSAERGTGYNSIGATLKKSEEGSGYNTLGNVAGL
jgi:hypothetical protein